MRRIERLHKTALRARELAAEFRTDIPLRDALMAYAIEVETQARERLSSWLAEHARDAANAGHPEMLGEAESPTEYWHRECAFLREEMLAFAANDGRRRILQALADECSRLADMLAARTK